MLFLAMLTLAVAVAASGWATAYALQEPLADLMWLQRRRQWDAWWDTIEAMHTQLDVLVTVDELEVLDQLRLAA